MRNLPGKNAEAVRKTGVDAARLDAELSAHADDITGLIRRNSNIAAAVGFQGNPGFLVRSYKVNEALNYPGFAHVVADARPQQNQIAPPERDTQN